MIHDIRLGAAFVSLVCPIGFPFGSAVAEPLVRPAMRSWTVADFDPVISVGLEGYRDFENGRRRFSGASCADCHRFGGEGPERALAPDLSKTIQRLSPPELLEAILSPSAVVAQEDAAEIFEMADGRVVEGRVVGVNDIVYRVSPDPRNPARIVNVTISKISAQRRSRTSSMPSGLVDTLVQEDVLDLLAYLLSNGNRNDPVFIR